jgi:hypothetical protein
LARLDNNKGKNNPYLKGKSFYFFETKAKIGYDGTGVSSK